MKRIMWVTILLALILMLVMALPTKAGGILPDGVDEWTREDGSICSLYVGKEGVALDCDCPCDCEESESQAALIPTDEEEDKPKPTDNPKPEPTKVPPTEEPQPTPEPKPEKPPKEEKTKCNAGKGNGSEGSPDCDPGNSGEHNNAGD